MLVVVIALIIAAAWIFPYILYLASDNSNWLYLGFIFMPIAFNTAKRIFLVKTNKNKIDYYGVNERYRGR